VLCDAYCYTRSPAVPERPRDALCLSTVSFNSTIRRAQSSVISYLRIRFTINFCSILFVVVVHAGCDKQDSLIRTGGVCGCTVDRRSCSYSTSHRSDYLSRIATFAYPTSPPAIDAPVREVPVRISVTFNWCGKTRLMWLIGCQTILKTCLFVSTESTDGQTDGQKPHDGIGRAYA